MFGLGLGLGFSNKGLSISVSLGFYHLPPLLMVLSNRKIKINAWFVNEGLSAKGGYSFLVLKSKSL